MPTFGYRAGVELVTFFSLLQTDSYSCNQKYNPLSNCSCHPKVQSPVHIRCVLGHDRCHSFGEEAGRGDLSDLIGYYLPLIGHDDHHHYNRKKGDLHFHSTQPFISCVAFIWKEYIQTEHEWDVDLTQKEHRQNIDKTKMEQRRNVAQTEHKWKINITKTGLR